MNLFDDIPDSEPSELTAGDLWAWTRSDLTADYPPASYTLKYVFFSQSSTLTKFEFTASKVDDTHKVNIAGTTTKGYKAGDYQYQIQIIRDSDSELVTVGEGFFKVLPALTSATGDIRSHARKVLDAINATIEKTATKEQQSYTVAGRSLARRSIDELLTLRDRYQRIVNQEEGANTGRVLARLNA